jgi:hypothetical protein
MMKNTLRLFLTWAGWLILSGLVIYQLFDYFQIRDTVRMYTAAQGKELCLRVKTLEADKMIIKPCE